jgi:hypothetical protein
LIVGFIGRMGSGKTLSMVKYAHYYYKRGYKVYSNVKLNFPYETYNLETLLDYANSEESLLNSVILCDEMHIFLDSRNSGSKRSRILSYFLLQTRKKDVKLFFTTQRFHQVDKRLRDNAEVIINCSSKFIKGKHFVVNSLMLMLEFTVKVKRFVFRAESTYPLYNTYEVVKTI